MHYRIDMISFDTAFGESVSGTHGSKLVTRIMVHVCAETQVMLQMAVGVGVSNKYNVGGSTARKKLDYWG